MRATRKRTNKDREGSSRFQNAGCFDCYTSTAGIVIVAASCQPCIRLIYMCVYTRVYIPAIRKYVHSCTHKCVLERERELLARREYSRDVDTGVDGIVFL